jgi:hypothetical protein
MGRHPVNPQMAERLIVLGTVAVAFAKRSLPLALLCSGLWLGSIGM